MSRPFQIIRANLRPYLVINAIVYGVFIAGFVAAMLFPGLRAEQVGSLESSGSADLVRSLFERPWLFALVILGVNVFKTAALYIVLPSLVVPFAGIAIFAYEAFRLGSGLVPTTEIAAVGLIPHSVTALIEFQAYSLVAFGAYLLGRAWLRPASVGADTRGGGYVGGLKQLGWIGALAFALFVVGAIWEAFSLRYLVHPPSELLL